MILAGLRRHRAELPFVLVALLAFPLAWLPPTQPRLVELSAAAGLTVLAAALVLAVPWDRIPSWLRPLPALIYLVAVALLRHAEGASQSGYAPLVLLPLFWTAMYGSRRDLVTVSLAIALTLGAPIAIRGAPDYPASEWRRVVIWLAIAPVIGATVQHLVQQVRASNEALTRASRTDPLTGLPNRRGWDDAVERAALHVRREGLSMSVALLDIDHFKRFNDTFGHDEGDALLREAAAAWATCLRSLDTLARWGGEEFVLLLYGTDVAAGAEVVERVRAATPRGQTVSAGLARWQADERIEIALARADAALYGAKHAGRDQVRLATARTEPTP